MQRLGVFGTFIRDTILPLNRSPVASVGGLYHSVAYASLLAQNQFEILPIARVGADYFDSIQAALAVLPNIDLSHLLRDESTNTTVTLRYLTATEREERTSRPMRPLQPDEVKSVSPLAGALVNFISGEDLSLEALAQLSETCLVYLDFHSLALGIDSSGKRFFRRPAQWQAYLRCADVVQMNEDEAACLWGRKDFPALKSVIGEQLRGHRTFGMHITLGANGVLTGRRCERGRVEIRHIKGERLPTDIVDIIGCGDAFGAAFFVHYLLYRNYFAAAAFANRIAALNATFLGSLDIEQYKQRIEPHATLEK